MAYAVSWPIEETCTLFSGFILGEVLWVAFLGEYLLLLRLRPKTLLTYNIPFDSSVHCLDQGISQD